MPDRSRSRVLALVGALAGVSACQTAPARLNTVAQPLVPISALNDASQRLTLANDLGTTVVDARDSRQVASGVLSVISSRVGGVEVVQDSVGSRLRITGIPSRIGKTPLFVIDGVPLAEGYALSILTRALERIDVFEDSSSTRAYGSRGANGVVLIATARPQ